jgi:7-cyano-7-deazaguanine reductase
MDLRHTPLGQSSEMPERYAPEALRAVARRGPTPARPILGYDVWTLWELAWRRSDGMPMGAAATLTVPAHSPHVCESKSLKLYLMSLNEEVFASPAELQRRIEGDVGRCVGAGVSLAFLAADAQNPGRDAAADGLPSSRCLEASVSAPARWPEGPAEGRRWLRRSASAAPGEQRWHTHLFRSLCPVTGQPDWASIFVWLRGQPIDAEGLLAYLLAFRRHGALHEQCVEQIVADLLACCEPAEVAVDARFLRRGGIDINPWRGTVAPPALASRLWRQ